MNSPKFKKLSEAPESNAGDDFHVLWAIRRSLELLDINGSTLQSVTVEGSEFNEGEVIDDTGEKLLSIDIGEYYDGESFEESSRVVFSQLKYSTRQSQKTFTLARLSYGDKSILGKLASTFLGYYSEFGRDSVIDKLKFKLVTNRPIESVFSQFLNEIQKHLQSKTSSVGKQQLKNKFPEFTDFLDRIHACTKLKSTEMVDFLRILDFKDCGTEPRFVQKQELIQAIAKYGSYESTDQYNRLYMLVNSKMMPEAKCKNAIKIEDILCAFNVTSIDSLYPVPAKLYSPTKVIQREHWEEVRDKILMSTEGVICVHGVGGIGKSTFVQSFNSLLPDKSETIIYDCYGQGTYFDESAIRHTYKNAIVQISNDLANAVGSPLLLSHELSNYDYVAELRKRIQIASKILGEVSSSAILTLVIDAADNSVFAAKNKGEECFVSGVISLTNLPKNCRIILTARTGRLNEFEFDNDVKKIELEAFNQEETGLLLKSRFPQSTLDDISEFHELTHRIPRVQIYSLENRNSLEDVFSFLKPYGESVKSVISSQIRDAKKNMVNEESVDKLLSNLIHLPRPIPIEVLSKLSKISPQNIRDFCVDLWSGIVLSESMISFRDEDFENYLRDEYKLSQENYSTISDELLTLSKTDEFSCEQLGFVLYRAEKYKLLQEIVLNSDYISPILDPVKKREVSISRTRYAILSCNNSESGATFFKLLYLSAEASKTDKARMQIVSENIDLISQFTELKGVQKLFFEITSNIHYGAANLECAAIFSKNEKTILFAKRHLRQAEAWLEMRSSLNKHERQKYDISDSAIAQGALSVLRIFGYEKFEKWLRRWKPRKIMLRVVEQIVDELLLEDQALLFNCLPKIKRKDVLLIVLVKIIEFDGALIDHVIYSEPILEFLKVRNEFTISFKSYIVSFCELLSIEQKNITNVLEILDGLRLPIIEHTPSFHGTINDDSIIKMDLLIRIKLLKATLKGQNLEVEELIPLKFKQKRKKEENEGFRERQQNELKDLFDKLLPTYQFKTHLLFSSRTEDDYSKMSELLKPLTSDYSFRHSRHDISGLEYFVSCKLIEMISLFPKKKQIIERLIADLKTNNVLSIRTQLLVATEASRHEETENDTLHILARIEKQVLGLTLNAHETIEQYVSCARLAVRIDAEEAEVYFQKAVEASTEIDLDAFDKLKSLHFLTGKLKTNGISLENQERGFRLAKLVESAYITLQGYDDFPWDQSIQAIQNLSIETSLACRCRWDHLDYINVFSSWSNVLREALTEGFSIEQTCGLLPDGVFDHEWQDLILELLNMSQNNALLQVKLYKIISEEVRIHTPLNSRHSAVKLVLELLNKSHLKGNIDKSDLESLFNFLNKPEKESKYVRNEGASEMEDKFLLEISKNTDYKSGSSLSEGLMRLIEGDRNYGYRTQCLFGILKDKCKSNEVVIHLNAILQIDSNIISIYELENVLNARLKDWGHRQVVIRWKKESFKEIIFKFLTISKLDYLPITTLLNLVELLDSTQEELAIVLKAYFTDNIGKFSVEIIYQTIEIFHHLLAKQESAEVLDWAIDRWELVYQRPLETLNFEIYEDQLPSISGAFAYVLRYCLAHPDKRYRWHAVNKIRRLAEFGDNHILKILIELRDRSSNECFKNDNYLFFNVSAKLWLFLTISKLSESHPVMIKPYFTILMEEAENSTMAHALIRYYAKSACQKICAFDRGLLNSEGLKKLSSILTPLDQGDFYIGGIQNFESSFPFDELDTIPYWYDNLGDIFKIGKREIAKLAENHITNSLGYSGNPHKDDEYSVSSYNYYLTSNRQGVIPTVEKIRTYHEYHAMFYVANDLIENYRCDEKHWRGWQDWLQGWLIASEEKWLEEIRQETPQEHIFWNFSRKEESSKNWLYSINKQDFQNAIQTKDSKGINWSVIACSIFRHDWNDLETISINSALVSRKACNALVRAFQTCESHYDYKFPDLNEDSLIEFNGMTLRGFYKTISVETKSEEELSYRVKTLMNVEFKLDHEFNNWIHNNELYGQEDFDSLIKFENWSDNDDKANHQSGFGTKGYRLSVRSDLMQAYLKELKENLIIECIIDRSPERNKEMKYIDASFKIYLINENGIEESA